MFRTESSASAVSRRSFMRLAGMASAALPILTEAHFARAAMLASAAPLGGFDPVPPAGAVLINSNENPLGPAKVACEAMARCAPTGGRYDLHDEAGQLTATFAAQNGLKPEYVNVYPGSSGPLHYAVLTYTSPTRSFVTADPSYEAGLIAAKFSGAHVIKIPLTADYAHDTRAMLSADKQAGLIYICNPNNPTGTLTPREQIEYALANKPRGSMLMVDEAYIHLSSAPSVIDLVAKGEDIIVLRTFSKIYGMAGIRCGIVAARPEILDRLRGYYGWDSMSIMGSAAANASLLDRTLIPERKKFIADSRNQTFDFLRRNNYRFIPSESNCFMIDTGRPGKQVIAAMQQKNVYIGRTWPIWPNHVRVSVGTPAEMAQFQAAFKEVMSAPLSTAALSNRPGTLRDRA